MKNRIEELIDTAKKHIGDSVGENAKTELELIRFKEDRLRNRVLFANAIILSLIALVNFGVLIKKECFNTDTTSKISVVSMPYINVKNEISDTSQTPVYPLVNTSKKSQVKDNTGAKQSN